MVTFPTCGRIQLGLVTFVHSTVRTFVRISLAVRLIRGRHGTFAAFHISSVTPLQRNAAIIGQSAVVGVGLGVTAGVATARDAQLPTSWEFGDVASIAGTGLAGWAHALLQILLRLDATTFRYAANNSGITLRLRQIHRSRLTLPCWEPPRIVDALSEFNRRTRDTLVVSSAQPVAVVLITKGAEGVFAIIILGIFSQLRPTSAAR
uniref:(northern house mosquito) hypothetical protein n=1 Tax=Culex pipiens TaxID=7175 RepID=A0A8D8FHL4_CULPI